MIDDEPAATTEQIDRAAPFGDRVLLVIDGAALQVVARGQVELRVQVAPVLRQGCERLGARTAFAGTEDFGKLIAKEDADLARLMTIIGLKK